MPTETRPERPGTGRASGRTSGPPSWPARGRGNAGTDSWRQYRPSRRRNEGIRRVPSVEVRAPGRVNLIGEHTDYSDGWCLPVAIDRECRIRRTPRRRARRPGPLGRARRRRWRSPLDGTAAPADAAPLGPLRGGRGPGAAPTAATRCGRRPRGALDRARRAPGLSSSTALSVALVPRPAPARRARARRPRRASPGSRSRPRSRPPACRAVCSTRWRRSTAGRPRAAARLPCRSRSTPVAVPRPSSRSSSCTRASPASSPAASTPTGEPRARPPRRPIGVPRSGTRPPTRSPTTRSRATSSPRTQRVLDFAAALHAGDVERVGADPARQPRQPPRRLPRSRRPSSTCSSTRSSTTAPSAPGSPAPDSAAVWSGSPRRRRGGCLEATVTDYRARTGLPATGFRVTPADDAGTVG